MKKILWIIGGSALIFTFLFLGNIPIVKATSEEPWIASVSPTVGPVGTEITITGTGFGDDTCYDIDDATCRLKVLFNGVAVEFGGDNEDTEAVSWAEDEIIATLPTSLDTGEVDIQLYRSDPDGENFDVTLDQTFDLRSAADAPAITKVYPTHAAVGDEITITGQNLENGCENLSTIESQCEVHIGDTSIDFGMDVEGNGVSWTDDEIVIKVPEGTETGEVRIYRNVIEHWGAEDATTTIYDITGDEVEIIDNSADAARAQEITDIEEYANALFPDVGFVTSFDTITAAMGLTITQDTNAETEAETLLDSIYGDFDSDANYGQNDTQYSMIFFVTYNVGPTASLGAGERAGVINSFRSAYDSLGPTNEVHWNDVLKIANGRWPSAENTDQESEATTIFERIYKRAPNRSNANDDAAVMTIAYGLRPEPRNTSSESTAIGFFQGIFGYQPQSALDWDVVRAIAYSGATR